MNSNTINWLQSGIEQNIISQETFDQIINFVKNTESMTDDEKLEVLSDEEILTRVGYEIIMTNN